MTEICHIPGRASIVASRAWLAFASILDPSPKASTPGPEEALRGEWWRSARFPLADTATPIRPSSETATAGSVISGSSVRHEARRPTTLSVRRLHRIAAPTDPPGSHRRDVPGIEVLGGVLIEVELAAAAAEHVVVFLVPAA